MSVFIDRFFPVKLDLLFSPSPFLQCDWWSSQWGRGESRGSQKGWGMMFDIDAPCIYQMSNFAIIDINLLCFFWHKWKLLESEPAERDSKPKRDTTTQSWKKTPVLIFIKMLQFTLYSLIIRQQSLWCKKRKKYVTVYFVQFDNQTTVIMM